MIGRWLVLLAGLGAAVAGSWTAEAAGSEIEFYAAVDKEELSIDEVVTLTVTLAADHRVADGHRGGLFLARVADLLARAEVP